MRLTAAFAAIVALASAAHAQTTLFVDNNALPGGDGAAWATAFEDLTDALDAAAADANVTEIRVAEGIYRPDGGSQFRHLSFDLVGGVTIRGGYAGVIWPDPDLRDFDLHPTILSGDLLQNDGPGFANVGENSYTVVRAWELDDPVVLDGIVVTGGNANGSLSINWQVYGAGIYARYSEVTLTNCLLYANSALRGGGAVANDNGLLTLDECHIVGNRITATSALYSGGAIKNWGVCEATDCLFEENTSVLFGGGFDNGDIALLVRCTFMNNSAQHAAALFSTGDTLLTDCEFIDNEATSTGAAIYHTFEGSVDAVGCTFAGNMAATGGGAIEVDEQGVCLEQCTFIGNSTDGRGGAIRSSASVEVIDCAFSANSAGLDGGAIFSYAFDDLTVVGCDFDANVAEGVGGALAMTDGAAWVEESLFTGNVAAIWAGAAYVFEGALTLLECDIIGNSADEFGGGVVSFHGDLFLDGCRLEGNLAGTAGGGIFNWPGSTLSARRTLLLANEAPSGGGLANDGVARLVSCTINGNVAGANGGGVESAGGVSSFVNCVLSANAAGGSGGAIFADDGEVVLASVTMTGNTAMLTGGGLSLSGPALAAARNSILWGNGDGSGAGEAAQIDAAPAAVDLGWCLVQGLSGSFGGAGNIDGDPLLREPAGLDGIAGTEDDDLRLSPGSPAVDAGDNTAIPADDADLDDDGNVLEAVPHDRDGHGRRFDDESVADTGNGAPPLVDLGAHEFDGAPLIYLGAPGGSWFDAGAWSGGALPGPLSDVVLTGSVVVDAPGAVARSIVLRDGGSLHITGGALTVEALLVAPDGALEIGGTSALTVAHADILAGAAITWSGGSVTLVAGGSWTQVDELALGCAGSAELLLGAGSTFTVPSLEICAMGALRGNGTVRGAVTNGGLVSPGESLGTLTIDGDFAQTAGGSTIIELRRLSVATEHDRLIVDDTAALGGALIFEQVPGFEVELGQSGVLLEADSVVGQYDSVVHPDYGGLLLFDVMNTDEQVELRFTPPTARLYVDTGGPANGLGTAWSSPFTDLEAALIAARLLPGIVEEIWLAEGVYVPTRAADPGDLRTRRFDLVDGVAIYGGFVGGEASPDERDIAGHPSVLSGDLAGDDRPVFANNDENSYHVVHGNGLAAPVVLDGLTVTAGNADGVSQDDTDRGAGVFIIDSPAVIRSCTFSACAAGAVGGVLHLTESDAEISDCTFSANAGGGLVLRVAGATVVSGCVFEQNTAGAYGGGMQLHATEATSSGVINGCTFAGNGAPMGGGLALIGSTHDVTVEACDFTANEASTAGGGFMTRSVNASLVDCTFTANVCVNGGGGAHIETKGMAVLLDGCIFTGNNGDGAVTSLGGGVIAVGEPMLVGCVFVDNDAYRGGGIYCRSSNPVLTECVFERNGATEGGAMHLRDIANASVTGCTFTDNSAALGGALFSHRSSPVVTGCSFAGNTSEGSGGAIWSDISNSTPIVQCTFAGNTAGATGGAISGFSSTLEIDRCRFYGNTTPFQGGALSIEHSDPIVVNSLFSGNTAGSRGGAIHAQQNSLLTIRSSVVAGNSASVAGGGLDHAAPLGNDGLVMEGCIFWQNTVAGAAEESAQISADAAVPITARYSCIQGLAELMGPGLIGDDPMFANAAGVDGIAGTEDDDLHLTPASPCINAGDPLVTDEAGPEDLDGAARVQVCRIDMGPYETDLPNPLMPDCNGNGMLDACEITDGVAPDCNGNGVPDECDIAGGTSPDCNGNGVPDACDRPEGPAFEDCNGNAIPDGCEIAMGISDDCNGNGVPDGCDLSPAFSGGSGPISPLGGLPEHATLHDVGPAAGPVTLTFTASGDLDASNETVTIYLNGVGPWTVFVEAGNCADPPDHDQLIIDAAIFNLALQDSTLEITMTASEAVSPFDCDESPYITVHLDYMLVPFSQDDDGDGIPDECSTCAADVNGSGAVDVDDLVAVITSWGACAGCAADTDGDGDVDVDDLVAIVVGWGPCE